MHVHSVTEQNMLINGAMVPGALDLQVRNPANGEVFAVVTRASVEQLNAAVAAAKHAQIAWASTTLGERQGFIRKFADAILERLEPLARLLVDESGKTLAEARGEVGAAAQFLGAFSKMSLPVETLVDDDEYRIELHRVPLGVVVGITPWNFPVLLASVKFGPALLLGNSFILKPAPTTPLTSLMLGQIARDLFPAGVFNVIVDANDLGEQLVAHPNVAKIAFTGSTVTGKKVMTGAASTLKRITLELGGNDACIVLSDVDVDEVAPAIIRAAFANAGQVCMAIKRVYAHSSVYDALCSKLAYLAQKITVGPGASDGVDMGAIQNQAQFDKAKDYLKVAHADGTVVAGGTSRDGPGYFIEPTIVRDIRDGSRLVDEEQFSPILPIIRFDDIDDAILSANATPYGLSGSIWSADEQVAASIARRIESGTIWVNHHFHFSPSVPLGGIKQSGIGAELGHDGLCEFVQNRVVSVKKKTKPRVRDSEIRHESARVSNY